MVRSVMLTSISTGTVTRASAAFMLPPYGTDASWSRDALYRMRMALVSQVLAQPSPKDHSAFW